jgi:hypothetical protein
MQVWDYDSWRGLPLREVRAALLNEVRIRNLPALGDMTVKQMMAMATAGDEHPIGIYAFIEGDRVMYAGKTHGRSLGERVITHLESRTSGWSMATAAKSLSAARGLTRPQAVDVMMGWQTLWFQVPTPSVVPAGASLEDRVAAQQEHIAVVENRLKWAGCLDPELVSASDRNRADFALPGGGREPRSADTDAGSENWLLQRLGLGAV